MKCFKNLVMAKQASKDSLLKLTHVGQTNFGQYGQASGQAFRFGKQNRKSQSHMGSHKNEVLCKRSLIFEFSNEML